MRCIPSSIASLSLSLAAVGQSVVTPAPFAASEGNSGNWGAIGFNTAPQRFLNIHDDMAGTPRVLRGMAFRRNADSTAPPFSITADLWASTATTGGRTIRNAYDANHGTDKVQTVTARVLRFPAAPAGPIPAPFSFDVPWDTPFAFAGSGPLCWEIRVTARTNTGTCYLDAARGSEDNPALGTSSFGSGCVATGRAVAMLAIGRGVTQYSSRLGNVVLDTSEGPANAPAVMLLGTTLFPVPLQLPGSASAPSGPCELYQDVLATRATMTTASGTAYVEIRFVAEPVLHGLRTFSQLVAADPTANPLGLVVSNVVCHNVVPRFDSLPAGCVFNYQTGGDPGMSNPEYTLVVQFRS